MENNIRDTEPLKYGGRVTIELDNYKSKRTGVTFMNGYPNLWLGNKFDVVILYDKRDVINVAPEIKSELSEIKLKLYGRKVGKVRIYNVELNENELKYAYSTNVKMLPFYVLKPHYLMVDDGNCKLPYIPPCKDIDKYTVFYVDDIRLEKFYTRIQNNSELMYKLSNIEEHVTEDIDMYKKLRKLMISDKPTVLKLDDSVTDYKKYLLIDHTLPYKDVIKYFCKKYDLGCENIFYNKYLDDDNCNNNNIVEQEGFKRSEYLYGVHGKYFKDMSYEDAIKEKVSLGKKLLNKLTDELLNINIKDPIYSKITMRITDVYKAIEFNRKLLLEMENKI